jgi:hypothetical protein
MSFEVKCNPTVAYSDTKDVNNVFDKIDDSDPCNPIVHMTSPAGCARFEATAYIKFLVENPWALGIAFIVLGAIMCFRGKRFLDKVLMSIGFIAGFSAIMYIGSMIGMLNYLDHDKKGSIAMFIVTLLVAVLVGVLCAWAIMKSKVIGIVAIGAFGGYMIGTIAYTAIITLFWVSSIGAIVCGAVGGIIGGVLSYKLYESVTMILTAFMGSYLFVRGVSMFLGGYPNEVMLYGQLST